MAKRPAVPKLVLGKDLVVHLPEGTARVIDFARSRDGEQMFVLRMPNADQVLRSREWLVRALDMDRTAESTTVVVTADEVRWNALPQEVKDKIEQRMRDLTLILTGDEYGDIVNGKARSTQFIDPRYDPSDSTLEERYERMAHDLKDRKQRGVKVHGGTAADTLRGQLSLVRATGDKTLLIHGNQGTSKAQPIPADVQRFIDDYVVTKVGGSKKSKSVHLKLLRDGLTQAGLWDTVSERRIKGAFEQSMQGRGLLAHSTTQRSKDGRPKQDRNGRWSGLTPYEHLEIDSTPINAMVIDQYGRITYVTDVLIAVCAVTRIVAGIRLITSSNPYDSREVRGLLWDCVRGAIGRTGAAVRAMDLPEWVSINRPTPRLPTRFGTANEDRGSQFNCFATIKALDALGSHARINDPGAGYQKPHVEALHRTFDLFIQQLPGHKGATTVDRGRHIDQGPMLRAEDMLELLHWFIERVYHRREHSQLYHPDYPGRKFTPNEYMDLLLKGPGGRLSMNQDLSTALGLLETKSYALQQSGLHVDHRWYNSDELDALKDKHLGEKGKPGLKIQVWIDDRHPELIYALPPDVKGPIALRDREASAPAPPLADLLDREIREAVGTEALYGSDRQERRTSVGEADRALLRVANELAIKPVTAPKPSKRRSANAADQSSRKRRVPSTTPDPDQTRRTSPGLHAVEDLPASDGDTPAMPEHGMAALFDQVLNQESTS